MANEPDKPKPNRPSPVVKELRHSDKKDGMTGSGKPSPTPPQPSRPTPVKPEKKDAPRPTEKK